MHSDKSSVGQQGQMRKSDVPRDYFCNRASGVSARLQDQQSMRSEKDAETVSLFNSYPNVQLVPTTPDADDTFQDVCCVCLETYSLKDQPVFTKCCETAIGSYCNAQNIADTGECWNCGKAQIQSGAVPEAGSWFPYHPKNFAEETSPLQLNGSFLPFDDTKTMTVDSQSCLENGSESASSDLSQDSQQHVLGLNSGVQKQQEAKQYLIEATNHLVEMCDAYGEIDDEVMDEILEALRGEAAQWSRQGIL